MARGAAILAARGCTVVAVDNDQGRLAALEQVKSAYISNLLAPKGSLEEADIGLRAAPSLGPIE